jgi:hypothetical protein
VNACNAGTLAHICGPYLMDNLIDFIFETTTALSFKKSACFLIYRKDIRFLQDGFTKIAGFSYQICRPLLFPAKHVSFE